MKKCRILIAVIALLMVGGLVASAAESEGSDHQQEVHHCIACCTTHHTATPTAQAAVLPHVVHSTSCLPTASPHLHSLTVIRLPDPPPEILA